MNGILFGGSLQHGETIPYGETAKQAASRSLGTGGADKKVKRRSVEGAGISRPFVPAKGGGMIIFMKKGAKR